MVNRTPNFRLLSALTKILGTVQCAPYIIGITVTFTFHSFFSSLARSKRLFLFSFSLIFSQKSERTEKSNIQQVLILWLIITRSGRLVVGDLLVSQNRRKFYVFHSSGQILVCACTIIIILLLTKFYTPALADSLSLESPQVSRTLLSILADLSNTEI